MEEMERVREQEGAGGEERGEGERGGEGRGGEERLQRPLYVDVEDEETSLNHSVNFWSIEDSKRSDESIERMQPRHEGVMILHLKLLPPLRLLLPFPLHGLSPLLRRIEKFDLGCHLGRPSVSVSCEKVDKHCQESRRWTLLC